jgi:sugar (pentulose or hexulose) kinase
MEKIAQDMKARMEALDRAGLHAYRIAMVGGPTESPVWTQILADAVGVAVELPEAGAYAGALGAAILAGIGARLFADEAAGFARVRHEDRIVAPRDGTIAE